VSDSNFSVNADGMTPAVEGLAQLGDRLGQITQHLESTLDGLGTPWGDDKNGHSFFQQYGKSRDQSLSGMSSMVDAVHGVSKGINTMIKGYNNIDDQAKERARNLQTTGGDSGGGGGGGGDQSQLQPTQSFLAARMPAEPLKRATLRKGELMPEESLRAREGEPVQPFLAAREPASPWLAKESGQVQSADPGVLPAGYMPAEQGEPAQPLSPLLPREGELMPAERGVPAEPLSPLLAVRDEAPSTEGTVTYPSQEGTPLEPREYSRLQPAIPGERIRMDASQPAEPLVPAERVRMDAVQPAQPLMAAEHVRMADAPLTEGTVTPLQPAHYMSVRPAIPAEQPVAFDRVEASMPAEQPLAFDRIQASTPGEPAGFAELEPERYLAQREPEVPKQ